MKNKFLLLPLIAIATTVMGCPAGDVNSDADAEVVYLGLDRAVGRMIQLGFDGFNAADSANIPTQEANADSDGTMTVDGQVDQGNSDNKGMRLDVTLDGYTDGEFDDPATAEEEEYQFAYDTKDGAPLDCDFSLKGIPTGTFEGDVNGIVVMSGDLEGEAELALTIAGTLIDGQGADEVDLESGTTAITGTVESPYGTFNVDILQ